MVEETDRMTRTGDGGGDVLLLVREHAPPPPSIFNKNYENDWARRAKALKANFEQIAFHLLVVMGGGGVALCQPGMVHPQWERSKVLKFGTIVQ